VFAHAASKLAGWYPTWSRATMPRSVAADQIGSNRGCMTGTPGTGMVPIRNARLPRSRMRVSSRIAESTSPKSRQVTGKSRFVWPSTASASHELQVWMTCRAKLRSSRKRALSIPSRQITDSRSMPLASSHSTRAPASAAPCIEDPS
jgi:hypothetical protein